MSVNDIGQQGHRSGPSVGTIVWGAIVIAIAGLLVSSRLGWFSVDPGLAAVALLLVAGLGLVVGGSLAASRSRRAIDSPDAADGLAEDQLGHEAESPRPNPYQTPAEYETRSPYETGTPNETRGQSED